MLGITIFIDIFLVGVVFAGTESTCHPLPAQCVTCPIPIQQMIVHPAGGYQPMVTSNVTGQCRRVHSNMVVHVARSIKLCNRSVQGLDAGGSPNQRRGNTVMPNILLRLPKILVNRIPPVLPNPLKVVTPGQFFDKGLTDFPWISSRHQGLRYQAGADNSPRKIGRQPCYSPVHIIPSTGIRRRLYSRYLLHNVFQSGRPRRFLAKFKPSLPLHPHPRLEILLPEMLR